ncbi:MAG TPA: c-type cytochrome [Anaeromyxobacter sp.]|nr:c-type cytochrome [Anaeromyxobacter sp.]
MAAPSPAKAWCLAAGALGLAVLVLAALAGALLLRGGISARAAPSPLEARIARTLRSWAIPSHARHAKNPVPTGPQAIAAGLAHWADHCAVCHANDGSGKTEMGRGLSPRPPDMRRGETQRLTDGELFYIIENGVRLTGMPAWGGEGSAEGSWQLVHFIRHLPDLTADERERMEALNPKSPEEREEEEGEEEFLRGGGAPKAAPDHGSHSHAREGR